LCRFIWEDNTAKNSQKNSQSYAEHKGTCEKALGLSDIFVPQSISHQHTRSGIDEQMQCEDELIDGLGEVDGTDTVFTDEVSDDDAVNHISQTT
jgi:hypothetical protein